uniref:NADH-ubiquinone oxidoreductase chain 2 n=1 Tax=Gymnorhamphichthys sp. NM-2010 TaxID=909828 RepID=F7UIB6_9TELE|nr:NADH dehydrogenase subunit 2 [Gymnorhamphichthys sp. NM-2010]
MSPTTLAITTLSLGLGTTITFTSSHWLLAWMGLEINTLAILPLMSHNQHPRAIETAIKYFLTQAVSTAVLLFAAIMNAWASGEWDINSLHTPLSASLVTLALALKVGLAPLHLWLPEVLQGLTLTTGLILATWQKLAPFALLIQVSPAASPALLMTLGITSAFLGAWGGLNQTQLRKIMAYSSIANLGWMFIALKFAPSLTLLMLGLYVLTTVAIFLMLKTYHSTTFNNLALRGPNDPCLLAALLLSLLSLAGLPPLTGFAPKWLIIEQLTKQEMLIPAFLLIVAALLNLYVYLRICYVAALTSSPCPNAAFPTWRLQPAQNTLLMTSTITITLAALPLIPLAFSLVL